MSVKHQQLKRILKKVWLHVSPTYRQVCGIEEHLFRIDQHLAKIDSESWRAEAMLEAQLDITKLPPAVGYIRDIQLANLMALREFDRICRKHHLKYWLDFGTLLGAYRHHGFIPWDDDMDVGMPISDYKKFLAIVDQELMNSDIACARVPSQIAKMVHRNFQQSL